MNGNQLTATASTAAGARTEHETTQQRMQQLENLKGKKCNKDDHTVLACKHA